MEVKTGVDAGGEDSRSDGNPMFTGGEIKLKLVSISFSAFVTVPPRARATLRIYLCIPVLPF